MAHHYQFTPPGVAVNIAGYDKFWRHFTQQRSLSLLKTGGFYTQVDGPTAEAIEAADITYLGGHLYDVSQTEADALTAAGYGSTLVDLGELLTSTYPSLLTFPSLVATFPGAGS